MTLVLEQLESMWDSFSPDLNRMNLEMSYQQQAFTEWLVQKCALMGALSHSLTYPTFLRSCDSKGSFMLTSETHSSLDSVGKYRGV